MKTNVPKTQSPGKHSGPAKLATVSYIGPPPLRGIPRLPLDRADRASDARMLVLEVITLVAHAKGHASVRRPSKLRACIDATPGRATDVWNVRVNLRRMPEVVRGIELTLGDVEQRLTDAEIQKAVDAWCRPAGSPRAGELAGSKWDHLAEMFARVGLGCTEPNTLKRHWKKWCSASGR